MAEMPLFSFSGTMEVVEDPPSYILDEDVFNLWYLNKTVRCILKTPLWKDKAKKQEYPHFCFNGGFCKYFESGPLLDAHFVSSRSSAHCYPLDGPALHRNSPPWASGDLR